MVGHNLWQLLGALVVIMAIKTLLGLQHFSQLCNLQVNIVVVWSSCSWHGLSRLCWSTQWNGKLRDDMVTCFGWCCWKLKCLPYLDSWPEVFLDSCFKLLKTKS